MIRGYVAIVDKDSPLPEFTPDSCRKAAIKLTGFYHEFYLTIAETDYNFKVVGNLRAVDNYNIARGIVRIGFITPNHDIVISCNPGDLKAFVHTVEVVKDIILPPRWWDRTYRRELEYICQGRRQRNGIHGINVTSYPYLMKITVIGNLVEIPEELGSLPCLEILDLSNNRLGEATNWNWLTSPFLRENLRELSLSLNRLSSIPESILGLRSLEVLRLSRNNLSELPDALGNLEYLRELYIDNNNLVILPTWVYREERFVHLSTINNEFLQVESLSNRNPQLFQKDFKTVAVPSLFQTVAKYIITARLEFWEYSIPATLTDYLEGAYYCRCGSIVLRDTISPVVQCQIKTQALSEKYYANETATILLRLCSYECYETIKPYITLTSLQILRLPNTRQ